MPLIICGLELVTIKEIVQFSCFFSTEYSATAQLLDIVAEPSSFTVPLLAITLKLPPRVPLYVQTTINEFLLLLTAMDTFLDAELCFPKMVRLDKLLKGKTVSAPPTFVLYPVILPAASRIGSKPPNLLVNMQIIYVIIVWQSFSGMPHIMVIMRCFCQRQH